MPAPVDPSIIAPQPQGPAPVEAPQPWNYASQSEQDKKLAADWLKRIDDAKARPSVKDAIAKFERNRKLLRGVVPGDDSKKMRSNLYFAELARMRPQVYAKDPEYSVALTPGIPVDRKEAVQAFAKTSETVLQELLVRQAKLKKRAKRLLTSCFTTSVGWWKLQWQETPRVDALIQGRIKDTQDNLAAIEAQRQRLEDPQACQDTDTEIARLREMLAGYQAQAEVSVVRGLVLDFVLSEDMLILDESIRELGDYDRAAAMAHRVWMTRKMFERTFGAAPSEKVKTYREQAGGMQGQSVGAAGANKEHDLLAVWEVWDQDSNRVFHVVEGGEGFCRQPFTPDWTGERWYPFFALAWNEIDGSFYPLSDIELIEPLVCEYNEARDAFVKDRKDARPFTVLRKGGSLTEEDAKNIRNRGDNDIILIEGVGNTPLSNDIQAITLGNLNPINYDTAPARADIEQILGGGDASRGSVLKAKTATEAEILSQGLRSRSAERTDIMEDLLSEAGTYALQICLRKMTEQEVKAIAGPDSSWPSLSWQQALQQVVVQVRGGSTGKPDRLQDQDRWTNLVPVIEKTVAQVSELRAKGQHDMANALISLTRETLRRFDERIELDQFLPPEAQDGQPDPAMVMSENQSLKAKGQELLQELDKLKDSQEKGYIQAAAQIATAADPLVAASAFVQALQALDALENGDKTEAEQPEDPETDAPAMTGAQPMPIQ